MAANPIERVTEKLRKMRSRNNVIAKMKVKPDENDTIANASKQVSKLTDSTTPRKEILDETN